jgi:hypothetical protein
MERYQVYKKRFEGGFMHITSLLAESRIGAIAFVKDGKRFGGYGNYYVTGLTLCIGEDISSNFPFHIQRRIKNRGVRVKIKGSLYDSRGIQQIRNSKTILRKAGGKADKSGSGKPLEDDPERGPEDIKGSICGHSEGAKETTQLTLFSVYAPPKT